MEVCKSYELPVEGICGGMAMCASCQVYVHTNNHFGERNDDEEDELAEQISNVMKEFMELKDVTEKLFGFMMSFVFDKDPDSFKFIEQYQDFEGFLGVNLFQSENFKIR